MNKVFIDQECNLCTSYGNWISEKNKNLDISYQNDLSPEEIKLDTLVYEKNGFRFYYSDAVLNSISDLGGIYTVFRVFKIFQKQLEIMFTKLFLNFETDFDRKNKKNH